MDQVVTRTWRGCVDGAEATIPVIVSEPNVALTGVAVVLHGRNGAPDQPQITAITNAYLAGGWRVVAPELPNSAALPESGPAQETTMGRHRRASEDVWSWTTARWPELPMAVAGHSLGAYAAAHIASAADQVQHVLAVSPALSGAALLEARAVMGPPALEALAREAPKMRAEMSNEDATSALQTVQARLAVVSGALDGIVPVTTVRSYFDAAPNGCFFAILPGHHHCPAGPDVDLVMTAALAALTPET